jgi:hypothetical protein
MPDNSSDLCFPSESSVSFQTLNFFTGFNFFEIFAQNA